MPDEITLGTKEWKLFVGWIRTVYSSGDANRIISQLIQGVYATPRVPIETSPFYQEWVKQGQPTKQEWKQRQETAKLTPEQISQQLRTQVTPEGRLPFKGNEWMRSQLEAQGFELVESDEWGVLPDEQKYYQKKETVPTATERDKQLEAFGKISEMTGIPLLEVIRQQFGLTAPQEGLTPWQTWQTQQDLWAREFQERQFREAEKRRELEQQNVWTEVTRRALSPRAEISDTQLRAQRAADWEGMRQEIVNQLKPSPRDWVAHGRALLATNPHQAQRTSEFQGAKENLASAAETLKTAKEIEKIASSDPNRSLSPTEQRLVQQAKDDYAKASSNLLAANADFNAGAEAARAGKAPPGWEGSVEWEGYMATAMAEGVGDIPSMEEFAQPRPKAPTMPEIPSWLEKVSGLKGRVPETRGEVQRPSPQLWTNLAPTQREMFAGLADWASRDTFQDLMAQMEKEIPKQPSLGKTWRPARQWA